MEPNRYLTHFGTLLALFLKCRIGFLINCSFSFKKHATSPFLRFTVIVVVVKDAGWWW
jgi:hypothetical protein